MIIILIRVPFHHDVIALRVDIDDVCPIAEVE